MEIEPAMIGWTLALQKLRPDLKERVMGGDGSLLSLMPKLCEAFDELGREAERRT
jgi:hypothetical protein